MVNYGVCPGEGLFLNLRFGRRQRSATSWEGAHSWDANEMASKNFLKSHKNELTTRAGSVISWEAMGDGISSGFYVLTYCELNFSHFIYVLLGEVPSTAGRGD